MYSNSKNNFQELTEEKLSEINGGNPVAIGLAAAAVVYFAVEAYSYNKAVSEHQEDKIAHTYIPATANEHSGSGGSF